MNRTEILVVILVALVLLALAVPWLLRSRETARAVSCQENLKAIGLALGEYTVANGKAYPFGTMPLGDWPPEKRFSWTIAAAAYRKPGQGARVLTVFDFAKPWDAAENRNPSLGEAGDNERFRRLMWYHCPVDPRPSSADKLATSSYVGMAGIGADSPMLETLSPIAGMWGYNRRTRLSSITDGLEHSICVLDTAQDNGPWTAGGPSTIRPLIPDNKPYLGEGAQFGGHHPKGCMILFADGRVRLFSVRAAPEVFLPLCTPAGE